MGDLINKKIKDTFAGIIKTSDENVLGESTEDRSILEDGRGNDSALKLGRVEKGIEVIGNSEIKGTLDASKVRVGSSYVNAGLVLQAQQDGSHIRFHNDMGLQGNYGQDAYIQTRDGNIGIGGTLGNSTNNLNIRQSDGFVGIKQKAPLAPLHVKSNGEAIRLESKGNNKCSIDFWQGNTDEYKKRGKIEFDNQNDNLILETTRPSGDRSKITFKVSAGYNTAAEEVMRIQGREFGSTKRQVVIGNPEEVPDAVAALYVEGEITTTGDLNVFEKNITVGGYVDARSFKLKNLNDDPIETNQIDGAYKGEIRFTADYIYVCVDDNVWKRVALTSI